jgi:hypothetical protein
MPDQLVTWLQRAELPDNSTVRGELMRWVPEYRPQ